MDQMILSIKVAQALVVILVGMLCIKANKILPIRGLYWLAAGFILNGVYVFLTTFPGEPETYFTPYWKAMCSIFHILSSFSFLHSFTKAFGFKERTKWLVFSVNVLFFFTIACFILFSDPNTPSISLSWISFIYNSTALFILAYFFYSHKETLVYKVVLYISFGFLVWAGLQMFSLLEAYFVVDLTLPRSVFSLLVKLIILTGFFEWCLDFSKESVRIITKEQEEKELFAETSKYFQNLIKVTFHEITIPIRDLEQNIRSMSKYTVREAKPKFRELQSSFERVQTIVAVAKNSYIEGVSDKYNNFEYYRQEEEEDKIVSINTLIEMAIKSIKGTFKGVNFIPVYGSKCYVECKQREIVQVLINLFKNAFEAYPVDSDAQDIRVRSYVSKTIVPKTVVVEVESYGSNIDQEIIDRIWEQGFSTKLPDETNIVRGQGLFITRQIMNRTPDASIMVESPITQKDHSLIDGVKFKLHFLSKAFSTNIHLNN